METKINTILNKIRTKSELHFDYEVTYLLNDINLVVDSKLYYICKETKRKMILNFESYWDSLTVDETGQKTLRKEELYRASIIKRLVSKKKKRFQNELFDLDMAYITKRIIAMGFPAQGCESIYRNSMCDVACFFKKYHNNIAKIYNLCIEKTRIYDKNQFYKIPVAFFPSKDHHPSPIRLILEFCIDLLLYLMKNPDGVVGIHCKAGKGRTGVMICCYLIFSGLCKDNISAMEHYAEKRTYNNKGVTIESQKRYIRYFENFLRTCYTQPYHECIPKMIKNHANINIINILQSYENDESYFFFKNRFKINYIKVFPFKTKTRIKISLLNIVNEEGDFIKESEVIEEKVDNYYCYKIVSCKDKVNSDLLFKSKSGFKFEFWFNLWHEFLFKIKDFLDKTIFTMNPTYHLKNEIIQSNKRHKAKPINTISRKQVEFHIITDFKENDNLGNEQIQDSDRQLQTNIIERDKDDRSEDQAIIKQNSKEKNRLSNDIPEIKEDKKQIREFLEKIDQNQDFNELIEMINLICDKESQEKMSYENHDLIVPYSQFDKAQKNKFPENFCVLINYSLIGLPKGKI